MGKPTGKKKKQAGAKTGETNVKRNRSVEASSKAFDKDTTVFVTMAQELKQEGNKLFQKRDHEGALFNYEKALKLLPKNHADMPYLHTNMATCYMQMGPDEYHKAIAECNLALEVSPKYSKALLKRARCYESMNRRELAFLDINAVLSSEPNNFMAQEIAERIKNDLENKGGETEEDSEYLTSPYDSPQYKPLKTRTKKKKNGKSNEKISGTEDKTLVEESNNMKEQPVKNVKLVMGEDIRWARMPSNCSIVQLREIVRNRFPRLKGVLIKYKDSEGDLVTITTTEELRWAETSAEPQGSVRLYVIEVSPDQELFFDCISGCTSMKRREEGGPVCIEDWIVQFARLFKNHVGFDTVTCLDLHEIGMKLYAEAMEDTVTSEEAQELFEVAAEKFQEMTALALFNWGNVHLSRARKRVFLTEDGSRESVIAQVKTAYDWAESEYVKAGEKYRESLKFKPDFYEGHLALGQQQFEQAKLSWYNAIGNKVNLETWPSEGLLDLFDSVEKNIREGAGIWEKAKNQHLNELYIPDKGKILLQKMGLDGLFKDMTPEEAEELHDSIQSQINLLMGTVLYERSAIEYKLGIQFWEDTLETAIENFAAAGASETDTAVMRNNHCSKSTAQQGKICQAIEVFTLYTLLSRRRISFLSCGSSIIAEF